MPQDKRFSLINQVNRSMPGPGANRPMNPDAGARRPGAPQGAPSDSQGLYDTARAGTSDRMEYANAGAMAGGLSAMAGLAATNDIPYYLNMAGRGITNERNQTVLHHDIRRGMAQDAAQAQARQFDDMLKLIDFGVRRDETAYNRFVQERSFDQAMDERSYQRNMDASLLDRQDDQTAYEKRTMREERKYDRAQDKEASALRERQFEAELADKFKPGSLRNAREKDDMTLARPRQKGGRRNATGGSAAGTRGDGGFTAKERQAARDDASPVWVNEAVNLGYSEKELTQPGGGYSIKGQSFVRAYDSLSQGLAGKVLSEEETAYMAAVQAGLGDPVKAWEKAQGEEVNPTELEKRRNASKAMLGGIREKLSAMEESGKNAEGGKKAEGGKRNAEREKETGAAERMGRRRGSRGGRKNAERRRRNAEKAEGGKRSAEERIGKGKGKGEDLTADGADTGAKKGRVDYDTWFAAESLRRAATGDSKRPSITEYYAAMGGEPETTHVASGKDAEGGNRNAELGKGKGEGKGRGGPSRVFIEPPADATGGVSGVPTAEEIAAMSDEEVLAGMSANQPQASETPRWPGDLWSDDWRDVFRGTER